MRPLILAAVALLAVGIANIDIEEQPVRYVKEPAAPPKVVTKVKTEVKTVYKERPVGKGTMTHADCQGLRKTRPSFREVVARYGWPTAQNGEDSSSDMLWYALTDGADGECAIFFWRGEIDDVDIEEDWL